MDLAELIARFRSALALSALRSPSVRPDLVILDEFHRYADLILPSPSKAPRPLERERAAVPWPARRRAAEWGPTPPRSASVGHALPAAAAQRRGRPPGGAVPRARGPLRLPIRQPSYASAGRGCDARLPRRAGTQGTAEEVRKTVIAAKGRLEALLRPLMARTERASTSGSEAATKMGLGIADPRLAATISKGP